MISGSVPSHWTVLGVCKALALEMLGTSLLQGPPCELPLSFMVDPEIDWLLFLCYSVLCASSNSFSLFYLKLQQQDLSLSWILKTYRVSSPIQSLSCQQNEACYSLRPGYARGNRRITPS